MRPLVRLVHWNEEEARERAARLKALGFTAVWRVLPGPDLLAELKTTKAVAIVVDLSRLPSHGRDVGLHVRRTKATRHLPLVFVGGEPEKVARVKALLADAPCTTWDEIGGVLREAITHPPVAPIVPASVFAPYAGRSVVDKLGIKPDAMVALLKSPPGFLDTLAPLPDGVRTTVRMSRSIDLAVWFVRARRELRRDIQRVAGRLDATPVWIAWPKKTSGVETDLGEAVVRQAGLAVGLVDCKVCAIDATWSGLLFRRRRR